MTLRKSAPVLLAALLSIPLVSCTVTKETGTKPDDAKFLLALSGPIREKYPDSTLLAEGQKVCDAIAQGKTEEQAKQMIQADLGVDSGQFIGAIYAGHLCDPGAGK